MSNLNNNNLTDNPHDVPYQIFEQRMSLTFEHLWRIPHQISRFNYIRSFTKTIFPRNDCLEDRIPMTCNSQVFPMFTIYTMTRPFSLRKWWKIYLSMLLDFFNDQQLSFYINGSLYHISIRKRFKAAFNRDQSKD